MSGYSTAQNILCVGYFFPTMFRDCILVIQKCHACHIYDNKTHAPPAPLNSIISIGPFEKWRIDFMTCNPHSDGGHGYIIVAVDYFTKWAKVMPTYNNIGKNTVVFFFSYVIAWFGVPHDIVTGHGKHFHNHMMSELTAKLGLSHEISTSYYLLVNGQVEVINKIIKMMLQCMIGVQKS